MARQSRSAFGLAFLILLLLSCTALPARAANWFEMNFWLSGPRYQAKLPACDNFWALGEIKRTFGQKEGRFWSSDLRIVEFGEVHEVAFSPWSPDAIPRRFCSATALVSDGVRRPVHYAIGEDLGLIGSMFGVEWCVVGLDRNWAYNPACRAARP